MRPTYSTARAARYHVYVKDNIKLHAETAVEVDLGYRIQLKPGLMVHTFAPAGLTGRQISAEGILTSRPALALYDQEISKGATICSAMVTRGASEPQRESPACY